MARTDIRHVVAGLLTFALFLMLANMIRMDYFESTVVNSTGVTPLRKLEDVATGSDPWKVHGEELKPCWEKPSSKALEPNGFVTFSLSRDMEYHISEVSNAVLITRHLGATLVLPGIVGHKPGNKRKFEELYDVQAFITSLDGIIDIANYQPREVSNKNFTVARVPRAVSDDFVIAKIEPLFKRKGHLKLKTYFPTTTVTKTEGPKYMNSISCLSVFEALKLQAGLQEVLDSMLKSLRALSKNSNGQVIAIDLRLELLGKKGCHETGANGAQRCFTAPEIGQFLKKIGFKQETTIYLTQNGWHSHLDALADIFPNTYTKDNLIPKEKVANLLAWEKSELTKVIDFYICAQSDVFVPGYSSIFYENVVGARIAAGKTHVLVPASATSAAAEDYLSPYISHRSHPAYSCFCLKND